MSIQSLPFLQMPRYEPPLESEPLLQPTNNANRNIRPVADQPQPARYQQLNMDAAATPISPTPRQYRPSPFRCAQLFDPCFENMGGVFNNMLPSRAMITGYTSGIIFAIGWWIFIDGCVFNSVHYNPGSNMNTLSFEDWVPGLLSTLALIMLDS